MSRQDPVVASGLDLATGDMLYASSSSVRAKLAIGSAGEVLAVSGGLPSWEPPGTPGAHSFANTSGLGASHTTSGLTAGQVLRATGATTAAFQILVAGDIPNLNTSKITAGTFNNDRIAESNVTQHEAALSLLAPQTTMAVVSSPTFTTLQHLQDIFHSSGWVSGGVLSDDGSQNINVTAGTGLIRSAATRTSQLLFFDWSVSNTNAISDGTAKFVGVQYNSGSPQIVVKATDTWDFDTDFPIGSVVREGSTLHISQSEHDVGDHANFMVQRMFEVQKFARDNNTGGLILSEDGANRYVTVSAGAVWERLNKFSISAIDTDPGTGDTFQTYKHVAGVFTLTTGVTTWPNTEYDNGTALVTMDANKYANLWFYLEPDGDLVMLYGSAQYTRSALAELEAPPSTIPLRLSTHAFLIGRMLFKKSQSSTEEINSVFDTVFAPTLVSDHGNLGGLTGDDHTQYTLESGSRAFSGAISHGGFDITSVGDIGAVTGTYSSDVLIGGGTDHGARLGINFGASDDIATFESTDATANVYIIDSVGSVGIRCSSGALHLLSGGDAGAITGTAAALILSTSQVATFAGAVNMGALSCTTINMNGQNLSNGGTITASSFVGPLTGAAPAGSLSGTTLKSTVVNSSLQNLGTQDGALDMGTNNITNVGTYSGGAITTSGMLTVADSGGRHYFRQTASLRSFALFQNTTTGNTTSDGFQVGINSSEAAELWNFENTSLTLATNNTARLIFAAAGAADFQSNAVSMGALTATTITTSGSVGIRGAIVAGKELTVYGASGFAELQLRGSAGNGGTVEFSDNGTALADIFASSSKDLTFRVNGTTTAVKIDSSANMLIGTTTAATGSPRLDVVGVQLAISDNVSDATPKTPRIVGRHYTNAEESVALIGGQNLTAENRVFVGGGVSVTNAATSISFYTAANTTTLTGTLAADITGVGASSLLHLRGKFKAVGTTTFNTVEYTWPGSDGGASDILTTDGAGGLSWTAGGGGALGGSGTSTKIAKWSATSTLTDSIITESGTDITIAGDLIVSGTGPHAFGGTTVDYTRLRLTGSFTSQGASTVGTLMTVDGTLTGASGDTVFLTEVNIAGTITTQTATENIAIIATLRLAEPAITDNLTGDITVATTLYVGGAPTEGESNYALWVDDGPVQIDDTLTVGGTSTLAALDLSGQIDLNTNNIIAGGTAAFTTVTANLTGDVTGNVSGSSGSTTGNAATATALATPRDINGVAFDGTAAITVTAAAGTLTGTTLKSTVVTSSLTSVGTLTLLDMGGDIDLNTNDIIAGGVGTFDTIEAAIFDDGGQVFNVKHPTYGAVGDGAADDTTAINDAVTAAANSIVIFPAGTYKTTADITIPSTVGIILRNGAKIEIASTKTLTINGPITAESHQIFSGSGGVAFGAGAATEILVAWFGDDTSSASIQGAIDSLPSTGGVILFTTATHTMTLTSNIGVNIDKNNVTFRSSCLTEFIKDGADINGLWFVVGADSVTGSFVKIHDITFDGLKFTGSATASSTNQIAIHGKAPSTNYDAEADGSSNIRITNCLMHGFTSTIACTGVSGLVVDHNDLGDNVFIPGAAAGGYCVLMESCHDVRVHHNRMISTTEDRHAVYVSVDQSNAGTKNNKNINIDHNFIDWSNTLDDGNTGLREAIPCRSLDGIVIDANIILGPMQKGITLTCEEGNSTDYVITNNVITGIRNATGVTGGGVVFVRDATFRMTDAIVTGNRISEASSSADDTYGIQLAGVDNVLVGGNVIDVYGTASIGIFMSRATAITLEPNRINGNGSARSGLAFATSTTVDDVHIFRQDIVDMLVSKIETISGALPTNIHYEYALRASLSFDGAGAITVTDVDDWIVSVVTDAVGCLVTVEDYVPIIAVDRYLTFTNTDGVADNFYFSHSFPTALTFKVGLRTTAGVFKPAATNANSFDILKQL